MTPKKVGEFFFGRHYNQWGVWQCTYCKNGLTMGGIHVADVKTYEEAVRLTWKLNGWGEPKYIKKIA